MVRGSGSGSGLNQRSFRGKHRGIGVGMGPKILKKNTKHITNRMGRSRCYPGVPGD